MPVKILLLHHVTDRPLGPHDRIRVSPDRLAELLDAHRDWRFSSHADALADAHGKHLVITFDDGYADNLHEALPVCERYDAPLTIFVVTGYLDRTVRHDDMDLARIAAHLPSPDGQRLYQNNHRRMRQWSADAQRAWLCELASRHGLAAPDETDTAVLTWEQVIELDRHPLVTIGAHSHTHPALPRWAGRAMRREAERCKSILDQRLGHAVEAFAYPYGRHSFLLRRAVADTGFRYAFTTRPRTLTAPPRSPMAIPRIDVNMEPGRAV